MTKKLVLGMCLALGGITGMHANTIAAGTVITVRTDTGIDARDTGNGRVYWARWTAMSTTRITNLRFRRDRMWS